MKYARGRKAVGLCQRSGIKTLLDNLVPDGEYPDLLVLPEWRDEEHPQQVLPALSDPVTLRDVAPDVDRANAGDGEAAPALTFDSQGNLTFEE